MPKKLNQIQLIKNNFPIILHPDGSALLNALKAYTSAELSVIPLLPNSKKPAIQWGAFMTNKLSYDALVRYVIDKGFNQIGIVTGKISNLLVVDCDNEATYSLIQNTLADHGITGFLRVKTPKGYHLWFFLDYSDGGVPAGNIKTTTFKNTEKGYLVDIKYEGGYVVAPPSRIDDKQYQFVNLLDDLASLRSFTLKEMAFIITLIERKVKELDDLKITNLDATDEHKFNQLLFAEQKFQYSSVHQINEDLMLQDLEGIYIPGQRNWVIYYLSGFLAKMGASAGDILALVEKICDHFNDEEKKQRLTVAKRSILNYFENHKEVKGISGLVELGIPTENIARWFKKTAVAIGWDQKITELFNQFYYAEANGDQSVIIWRSKNILISIDGDGISIGKFNSKGRLTVTPVSPIIPLEGKVYIIYDPAQQKSDSIWMRLRYMTPFDENFENTIEGPIEHLFVYLRKRGEITYFKNGMKDVVIGILSTLAIYYARKYGIEIKYPPGIFFKKGSEDEIVINHVAPKYTWQKIDLEKLKHSLNILNKISEYFNPRKIGELLLYGIVAPFNFVLKQKGIYMRYLFLNGPSKTGKTTLANLLLGIFNLPPEFNKGGGAIDTVARIGEVFSLSTFPVVINEPMGGFRNGDVVEIIKHGQNALIAREKLTKDGLKDIIPAYSYLVFTSNHLPFRDDALERRLKFLDFSYEDRPLSESRCLELQKLVNRYLYDLKWIGNYVLQKLWDWIKNAEHEFDVLIGAKQLWEEMYNITGVPKPAWLTINILDENITIDLTDDNQLSVISFMKDRWVKMQKEFKLDKLTIDNFKELLKNDSYVFIQGEEVYLTKNIIQNEKLPVTNLKSLAEIIGGEYLGKIKIIDHSGTRKIEAVKVSVLDLYNLIFGEKFVETTSIDSCLINNHEMTTEPLLEV